MKSRTVAEQSILKWSHIIDQMEDQIYEVLQEERFWLYYLIVKASFFIFHFHFTSILLYLYLYFYFFLFSEERVLRKAEMEATKVLISYLALLAINIDKPYN